MRSRGGRSEGAFYDASRSRVCKTAGKVGPVGILPKSQSSIEWVTAGGVGVAIDSALGRRGFQRSS